jgi:hypothetical protein
MLLIQRRYGSYFTRILNIFTKFDKISGVHLVVALLPRIQTPVFLISNRKFESTDFSFVKFCLWTIQGQYLQITTPNNNHIVKVRALLLHPCFA